MRREPRDTNCRFGFVQHPARLRNAVLAVALGATPEDVGCCPIAVSSWLTRGSVRNSRATLCKMFEERYDRGAKRFRL